MNAINLEFFEHLIGCLSQGLCCIEVLPHICSCCDLSCSKTGTFWLLDPITRDKLKKTQNLLVGQLLEFSYFLLLFSPFTSKYYIFRKLYVIERWCQLLIFKVSPQMVAECQMICSELHPHASSPTANLAWAGPGSSVLLLPRIIILFQDEAWVE